ncbi:MAG: hypothetical protein H7Y88_07420 [Phycisphaerales bacterium]|nr:hypothetical protein [Phycisphaerales bacterium]
MPFQRSYPGIADLPDEWSLTEGTRDRLHLVLRSRSSAARMRRHPVTAPDRSLFPDDRGRLTISLLGFPHWGSVFFTSVRLWQVAVFSLLNLFTQKFAPQQAKA